MVKKMDQVYYNTRVSTQVNMNQHESTRVRQESTRVRHEATQVNASPTEVNTNQHEPKTSLDHKK